MASHRQKLEAVSYQFPVTLVTTTTYFELTSPSAALHARNERMYGALTGQSKQMIANKYGEDQLKKWRRGFKVQPPAVSSYSLNYPGNDYRRAKQVRDLRVSLSETINRSIEAREVQVHRKFPKTESLWNCVSISTNCHPLLAVLLTRER